MSRDFTTNLSQVLLGQAVTNPTTQPAALGWTWACWAFPTGTSAGGMRIFNWGTLPSNANQASININASTSTLSTMTSFATTSASRTTKTTMTINAWNFIAWTWDGTTAQGGQHVYMNHTGDTTLTEATYASGTTGNGLMQKSTTLIIGNREGGNREFIGRLAHVGYFNAVLNAAQLTAMLKGQAPAGADATDCKGYWPLAGLATEPDLSGAGHNGTVTNTSISTDPFQGWMSMDDTIYELPIVVPTFTFYEAG